MGSCFLFAKSASATTVYFGYQSGSTSGNGGTYLIWNNSLTFTCPGTGAKSIDRLEAQVYVSSGTSYIGLAIYTLGGVLVAKADHIPVSNTSLAWVGVDGSGITWADGYTSLTGGTSYKLAIANKTGINARYTVIGSGAQWYVATDYTSTMPDPLPTGTSGSTMYNIRVGVPAGALTAGVLSETTHTSSSATVSWGDASGGTAPITAQLERSPSGAGTWSNVSGATASPVTDTGLDAATAYDYRVAYTDTAPATVYSNTVTITTDEVPVTYTVLQTDLWENGYDNISAPRQSTFAKFVFITNAASITVTGTTDIYTSFPSWAHLGVVVDGVSSSSLAFLSNGTASFSVSLGNLGVNKTVEIISGLQGGPIASVTGSYIDSVAYTVGSYFSVLSPTISNRILIYGDSIAAGASATYPEKDGYIPLLRNTYGHEVMAEAWGGRNLYDEAHTAGLRTTLVNRLVGYSPSIIWFAIGTNDYGLNKWNATDFGIAYAATLDASHAALPSAKIVCQTPLVRISEAANGMGSTLGDYRTQITTVCNARSWTTLVDGTQILTTSDLDGDVHPSTSGHAKYATNVRSVLAPFSIGTDKLDPTGNIRIDSDGKYGYTTATSSSMSADFSVTPAESHFYSGDYSEWLDISDVTWGATKQWTASSSSATTTIFTVGDLTPNMPYTVTRDSATTTTITGTNCTNGICTANDTGFITFTYDGGYSTHIFTLTPDTTIPTITLTAPINLATVSGSITLTASASDDIGVTGVQFTLNGVNYGQELTTAPYTTTWDTATLSDNSYTLAATVRDASNHYATSTLTVTVKNTSDRHSAGTSVSQQLQNLQAMGNTQATEQLKLQYPGVLAPIPTELETLLAKITELKGKIALMNNTNKIPAFAGMTNQSGVPFLTRSWSLGQQGTEVKQIQRFLNAHGFSLAKAGPGSLGKETTYFGYATKAAVIRFQKANKIDPIGIVGPRTRRAMAGMQ